MIAHFVGLLTKKVPTTITYVDMGSHFTANENVGMNNYKNDNEAIKYFYIHAKSKENFVTLWKQLVRRMTPEQKAMVNDKAIARWKT